MATLHRFSDKLGQFVEANGLPRMAGRVLGHLLTCDPPEQTFDELVNALAASRSSVSVSTRLLMQLGLVERFGLPGERRDRYRLKEDAWTVMLRQDVSTANQLRLLAQEGLALMRPRPPARRKRLLAMHEFFTFLEETYTPILGQWEKRRARQARRQEDA